MKTHTVRQGECMMTIARQYGFSDWRVIYDTPDNESLRKLRTNPHCLLPGDKVHIPDKDKYRKTAQTNKKHKYVLKNRKNYLSVRLVDRQLNPLADIPYNISFFDDGNKDAITTEENQATDSDGFIQKKIPAKTTKAVVSYFPYKNQPSLVRHLTLKLSQLDPVDEESGKRERMRQLGFPVERTVASDMNRYSEQINNISERFSLAGSKDVEDFLENPNL